MTYSASATLDAAKSRVGFHEGPNNENPFSLWQYGQSHNPWCASFQCWAQYQGGYRFIGCTYGDKGEAYTPTEKLRAEQQGTWRDKTWRAQPGDAVLYDWGNNGVIDHVEIVLFDDGVKLITIGGNTSDAVMYRTRDRTYVAGFWALSQDPQAAPPIDLAEIAKIVEWHQFVKEHELYEGMAASNVITTLNRFLVALGWMIEPKNMNVYGKPTVAGVRHMKTALHAKYPTMDHDGTHLGAQAADALLAPKAA